LEKKLGSGQTRHGWATTSHLKAVSLTHKPQNERLIGMKHASLNNNKSAAVWGPILAVILAAIVNGHDARAAQAPVNLGTAGNFVILAKSGISTVPSSAVTGDIGVSPIDSTAITGFSSIHSTGSAFAISAQINGKAYAADYASPTPANLTTAVGDMQTAYTDAAGRVTPDFTELGGGQIGGLTLVPGLYKWGTDVLLSTDVTLNGGPNSVWIFQIAGKLVQANGTKVILSGGALAQNIFWQSFGVVSLGTTAHFEGNILAETSIALGTGASVNGRLLAQTAVTLDASTVTTPNAVAAVTLVSATELSGPYAYVSGHSVNLATKTITSPLSGSVQFYRIRAGASFTIKSITTSGGNVVITYN
jgi:hypothetical protein